MKRTHCLAPLVAIACATGGGPHASGYASAAHEVMFEAAVRVVVGCFDGRTAVGSGVAITRRHVITARHLLEHCGGEPAVVTVITRGGETVAMVVDEISSTADVSRLVADGVRSPFRRFALVRRAAARAGETVCTVASDGTTTLFLMRCGAVAAGGDRIVTALDVQPGHSGGPLYDGEGQVVGVWATRGVASGDRFGVAAAATVWRALVVTDAASLGVGEDPGP